MSNAVMWIRRAIATTIAIPAICFLILATKIDPDKRSVFIR